jgi:hypothetical protein
MTIPGATTSVTVTRVINADPNSEMDLDSETDYAPPSVQTITVAQALRATFTLGSGERQFAPGGERERTVYKFVTDTIQGDTILGDDILTEGDGQAYTVLWSQTRNLANLRYITGECYQETGAL